MTNTTIQPNEYVGLHTHTDSSILDGFTTVKDLVKRVKELGQDAVVSTDHGNLHNSYALYAEAKANGIKPLIGIEAYVAPSPISHKVHEAYFFSKDENQRRDDVSSKGSYTHLLLFAKNNEGLKALYKLSELSYTEGYWRKPRMSVELFEQYANGNLIATTGCPSGELQTLLRLSINVGRNTPEGISLWEKAVAYAKRMQSIFGKENYFMELMNHDMSIDLERKVEEDLLRIAEQLDIPLLATADSHYTYPTDANAHEHLLCISTHSKMNVPTSREEGEGGKTRFAFDGEGYYVHSAEEMLRKFPEDKYPGAVRNSAKIAAMCNVVIEPRDDLRPKIDLPEGETEESYIRKEAFAGLARRLPDKAGLQEYIDRLEIELGVIVPKNYSGYFLVVSDFLRWAKANEVPCGPGRGSAAGSLLAYCLDITDADPIRFGLLFERFLNPERESPPDIDIDLNDTDRERVIEYVKNKYGAERVAQVVTFGKILAKNAVKDTVRILDLPYALGDQLTKAMPDPIFGKTMPLKDMYDPTSARYDEAGDFRNLVKQEQAGQVVDIARQLEGRIRSTGVHAAAVVVSGAPVVENIPMMMRQADGAMITQWDYPTAEHLGLLKFDFLGLRNLGVIRDAVKHIKNNRGIDIDVTETIEGSLDDPKVYELLGRGNTLGVFQLDGGGLQSLLKLMKPTEFEDISAVLSLYRPGPMGVHAHTDYALRKNGLQKVDYIHPDLTKVLTPILGPTFGLVIYQEQVQLIAREMAGYSLGQADNLRRAMGKKKREVLEAEFIPFSEGCYSRGYSKESVKAIWDVLVPFADYAFNKSHTVAYGLISYMTAWLKANYPSEFYAALLSSVSDDSDKTAAYLEDARVNGIRVLPPDVSRSEVDYVPLNETEVLFGLRAVRGIGANVGAEIAEERRKNGPYKDFNDLIKRSSNTVVNKRVLEGLSYGGAFDGLGVSRRALIYQIPELVKQYQKVQRSKGKQQMALFDFEDSVEYVVLPMDEYPRMEKLSLERNALGLYVSGHPIDGLNISNMASVKIGSLLDGSVPALEGWPGKGAVPQKIAGVLTSLAVKRTKKGEKFGIARLEDRSGAIECPIFPRAFVQVEDLLKVDGVYQFTGFARVRDETVNFPVDSARPLEFSESGNLSVRLKVTEPQWLSAKNEVLEVLKRFPPPLGEPGDNVIISIKNAANEIYEEVLDVRVQRSPALIQRMHGLLGSLCVGRWRAVKTLPVDGEGEESVENSNAVAAPVAEAKSTPVEEQKKTGNSGLDALSLIPDD